MLQTCPSVSARGNGGGSGKAGLCGRACRNGGSAAGRQGGCLAVPMDFSDVRASLFTVCIAVIPYKPVNPKTRLSCLLDQPEREAFAALMLSDVVSAVRGAGLTTSILATGPCRLPGIEVIVDGRGLNDSLNGILSEYREEILIIMADLPLVLPGTVGRLLSADGDIVLAPGRGGGTNAIYVRTPGQFHVDYYGASFLKHLRIVKECGLAPGVFDSFRLHTDIDEKEDLVELLIHGQGESRRYLERLGFSLRIEKGRVSVEREGHEPDRPR